MRQTRAEKPRVIERSRMTLAAPTAVLRGVGLHSGVDATLRLLPAPCGTGRVFRDPATGQEFPACTANIIDTSRCTRLGLNGFEVQTVEHVLSALAGLGVEDAIIEVTGGEVPAVDGSAGPFVALLQSAGLCSQGIGADSLKLAKPIRITEGRASLTAFPAEKFSAAIVLDYPHVEYLGTQAAIFDEEFDDYAALIAPARTFGFLSEIEALHRRGLGLGATRDNAVVLGEEKYETPLRFSNELARHKMLDLIGDLALTGRPLQAAVFAVKPGHSLNTRLASLMVSDCP